MKLESSGESHRKEESREQSASRLEVIARTCTFSGRSSAKLLRMLKHEESWFVSSWHNRIVINHKWPYF